MMVRMAVVMILVAGGLAAGVAHAQTGSSPEGDANRYLTVLPFYTQVDDRRGTNDDGLGISIGYGSQLSGGWYWEGQAFADVLETGVTGFTDYYQYGLGLDLHYRFLPGAGASPFVLFGGGLVRNNVIPNFDDDVDLFGNVGLGFVTSELGKAGVRLRFEARYIRDGFQTGGVNDMNDWRFGLAIQVPLGRRIVEREVVRDRVITETVPAEIIDSDGDGVPDLIDRCPGTLAGLATDNQGCAAENMQTIRLEGVNFESNSAQLTPGALDILRHVADSLRGEPNLRAEIAGHTDNAGSADYNLSLSQERADAVFNFLVDEGIGRSRLEVRGFGESRPLADNGTATGRRENRRVELRVLQ